MPQFKPVTKNLASEQVTGELKGELGTYKKFGLLQRSLSKRSVYRYVGVMLKYQKALGGQEPTLQSSMRFLAHLREQGFDPNTLKVSRAALKGFHQYRGEDLIFLVKVPHRQPRYIEPHLIEELLRLSADNPRDHLILLLMSQAGLRRAEVAGLRVSDIGEDALRLRGKGGRERTIPLCVALRAALKSFCSGKHKAALAVGCSHKAVYCVTKKYGKLAGKEDLKPHDLRHSFAERLCEKGANLRVVQELLGHESLDTTQVYIGVTGSHLKETIKLLDPPLVSTKKQTERQAKEARQLEDELFFKKEDFVESVEVK